MVTTVRLHCIVYGNEKLQCVIAIQRINVLHRVAIPLQHLLQCVILLQCAILLQCVILLQHAILLQRTMLLQNHFYLSYTTVQVWDHTTIYIWRVTITPAKRLQQIQCKRSNDLIADHHPKKTTNYSAQHKQRDGSEGDDFNRFGITD